MRPVTGAVRVERNRVHCCDCIEGMKSPWARGAWMLS